VFGELNNYLIIELSNYTDDKYIKYIWKENKMRKLTGKCKWILAVLLVTVSMAAGCNKVKDINADVSDPSEASHKISVVATVFPYYDFARAIGGEYLDVTLLLPPGRDSHSFEPTAQDLLALQSADIFLYNGGEMETWVEEVLEAVPRSHGITFQGIETVDLLEEAHTKSMKTTGHSHDHDEDEDHNEEEEHDHDEEDEHHHDEYDEHIWTSLENAQLLVSAIEEIFCEADPEHEKQFRDNAAAYREQIADVQSEIEEIVDNARVKKILFADRFPFLYFTQEFGLDYDAAFAGCAGDTEPSARVIASLIEEIQSENIKAIYHVEMGNTKTAQMIQEATGVEILELHSCHTVTSKQLQEGVTYVELMRQNAENLKKGLQ